jgi:hypothetical protein
LKKVEASDENVEHADGQLIGLLAVFVLFYLGLPACTLKDDKSTQEVSVYMRNMQLAIWSILLGLVPVFSMTLTPSGKMDQDTTVVVLMCPGHDWTCCSTVMKYGDTILKGICNISSGRLGHRPVNLYLERAGRWWFVGRAAMVMTAVALYSNTHPQKARDASQKPRHLRNQVDVDA